MADEATETATTSALQKEAAFCKYWQSQLDAYYEEFEPWEKRATKIIKRYRDDRDEKSDGTNLSPWRFNSLWSNVQTLLPAIYIKPPQPNVERRYLDKDPLARFASMTLERSLEVTIQECGFHQSTKKAVLDYLLVGRGVTWDRYEPTYGTPEDLGDTPTEDESTTASKEAKSASDTDGDEEGEENEAPRPVTWEKVYTDYVGFKNFRHSVAPVWEEVTWVAKREMLTRKELRTRFTKEDPVTGKPLADLVPLQSDIDRKRDEDGRFLKGRRKPMAEVWEIWDKTSRQVIFYAPDFPTQYLEKTDDPLKLQEFWPCQRPLYATVTNDTLIPVPDYIEYQDQAQELDNLTARIKALTDAVRVNGVYDASYPELKRILQEGSDNRLIGVAKYAEFAQKGGLEAAISFVPIKEVVEALIRLYEARDRVKADMAEITGLSDIVRGQAQGSAKTATEQRIKGQFATLRLQDRQAEIARFCRDGIAITAEIIAEQFSPEILAEMTGMETFIADEIKNDPKLQPPPQMMGHNGGPPMEATPAAPPIVQQAQGAPGSVASPPGAGMQPPMMPPPPPDFNAMAKQVFMQAVALLKDDKMRTFRIDIETDSTIEVDRQAAKDSVVELFTAVGGFLEKAIPIGQMMPQLTPALGQSILFAFRRFGAGRDLEGMWEQAIDDLIQQSKKPQPKPPSPEEIKAQAEMAKQQAENQRMAAQAQIDQQNQQAEMAANQQKMTLDAEMAQQEAQLRIQDLQAEMAFKEREYALKERAMMLDIQAKERLANIQAQSTEHAANVKASSIEHAAEVAKDVAKQKADNATDTPND